VLLQDFHLIDKLAHFDRERIPERVVHAKGAGAWGYFETTNDVTKFCKAKLFDTIGKRTPVFLRFSTVGGEKGSADTERDPRGFAIKLYTEEGNWDMVIILLIRRFIGGRVQSSITEGFVSRNAYQSKFICFCVDFRLVTTPPFSSLETLLNSLISSTPKRETLKAISSAPTCSGISSLKLQNLLIK
jgi:hypothetical protein